MKIKKLFQIMVLTLSASVAWADPLTLSPGDQQNIQNCIFAGTGSCSVIIGTGGSAPGNTPTGDTVSTYADTSWEYTVGYLINVLLEGDNLFNIGIDSNWANATPGNNASGDSEFLDLFQVWINDAVEFVYSGGGAMDDGANGNGNENWILSTVNLSAFEDSDVVTFRLEMSGLTDGFEQFGLVRAGFTGPPDPCVENPTAPGCGGTSVPEPGTLGLLGLGLLGLAARRRREV